MKRERDKDFYLYFVSLSLSVFVVKLLFMSLLDFYFGRLAAAFVRGKRAELSDHLSSTPLDELAATDLEEIIKIGLSSGLRLHKFKRTMGLTRVQRVLGVLKGLDPDELLDIGSGRGAFLWPLLDSFPQLKVTSIDQQERRVADIRAVSEGGIDNLDSQKMSATDLDFGDGSFDVITMLEVLEHIPEAQKALSEAVRAAKRFVLLSVPSKEDGNPEHIHLLDQKSLTRMLETAGALRIRFEYVLNHLIAIAKVAEK